MSAAECRDLLAELDEIDEIDVLVAVDDRASGQTFAVARVPELRRAATGGRAGPAGGHRRLRTHRRPARFLRVGDRPCRMPGCRRRPGRARTDLDHVRAHAEGGPTACQNPCCLCQRHHRIKTLAAGWSFQFQPDGRLQVRTAGGSARTTDPPGWHPDPDPRPDPPWLDDTAPPDPMVS